MSKITTIQRHLEGPKQAKTGDSVPNCPMGPKTSHVKIKITRLLRQFWCPKVDVCKFVVWDHFRISLFPNHGGTLPLGFLQKEASHTHGTHTFSCIVRIRGSPLSVPFGLRQSPQLKGQKNKKQLTLEYLPTISFFTAKRVRNIKT